MVRGSADAAGLRVTDGSVMATFSVPGVAKPVQRCPPVVATGDRARSKLVAGGNAVPRVAKVGHLWWILTGSVIGGGGGLMLVVATPNRGWRCPLWSGRPRRTLARLHRRGRPGRSSQYGKDPP